MGRLFRAAADGLAQSTQSDEDGGLTTEVVVHVDADVLTGEQDTAGQGSLQRSHLEGGPAVSRAVIERLACDARMSLTTHAEDGRTVDIGRSSRRPSSRQRKALMRRDAGCAMPACRRTRFLHAHHVVFWSRGGPTSLDNLVLLCGLHHRLLHEGAFTIEALGRQQFRFRDPEGAPIDYAPVLRGDRTRLATLYAAPDGQPIDSDTVTGRWDGTALDPDLLISSYIYVRDVETGRAAERRDPWARHVAA